MHPRPWLLIAIFGLSLVSCTTPETVSKFCGAAMAALDASGPVFDDMKQSCLREVNSRSEFFTFRPPLTSDPECSLIGDRAEGAKAAAKLLAEYFSAVNALASFGTADAGKNAQSLAAQAGAAAGAGSATQNALGSIAQFLVSTATSGYQRKSLEKDLTKASGDVATVSTALEAIVRDDYIGRLLATEEQKLSVRYREFAQGKPDAVKLQLEERWRADEHELAARRDSATRLVAALEALSEGFKELARNSHHLNSKELPGLLDPYVTEIQTLVPQIEKAI